MKMSHQTPAVFSFQAALHQRNVSTTVLQGTLSKGVNVSLSILAQALLPQTQISAQETLLVLPQTHPARLPSVAEPPNANTRAPLGMSYTPTGCVDLVNVPLVTGKKVPEDLYHVVSTAVQKGGRSPLIRY